MVVVDVVVNDSGGGHPAETEGQGYGRQAKNGSAGQRGQETHWMILSGVAGDSARGVGGFNHGSMPAPETSYHPIRFRRTMASTSAMAKSRRICIGLTLARAPALLNGVR